MELWGLVLALFALIGVSLIGAIASWLILRRHRNGISIALLALVTPISVVALFLSACYGYQQVKAATGHKHFWFFVATCPLTGGYDLTFDSKFRLGSIVKHGANAETGPVQGVAALELIPSGIAGQYANGFGQPRPDAYFYFDTRTGRLEDFNSRSAVEKRVGPLQQLKTLDETFADAP
jgi:hypothetical protein